MIPMSMRADASSWPSWLRWREVSGDLAISVAMPMTAFIGVRIS